MIRSKKSVLLLVLTLIGASMLIMPVYGMTVQAFDTRVESGSSVSMSVVNMMTTTNAGFVVSEKTPVKLDYHILVTDLNSLPSQGQVTSFMQGSIQESGGSGSAQYETIEFNERTSASGQIYLFQKNMHYDSGFRRVREA
jgi:uncharacterized membrane protein